MTTPTTLSLSPINATTACWPDRSHTDALATLVAGTTDPLLGPLSLTDLQLCPQNHGILSPATLQALQALSPRTRFRVHANVRIDGPSRRGQDASWVTDETLPYYAALGALCDRFHMPAYTLHAGLRERASRADLVAHLHTLQTLFPCPVGVEPMYPAAGSPYLLDTWDDLAWLLESGLPFALDLSHLHILATRSRRIDESLTLALLTSPHCLEIHLSGNDGRHDRHRPLQDAPWWWPIFVEARTLHPAPTVFSEGNHAIA